jgi:dihydroxyacid dehydratase/phosphogluconate dehydratase
MGVPLALVRDGDRISLDVDACRREHMVNETDFVRRGDQWNRPHGVVTLLSESASWPCTAWQIRVAISISSVAASGLRFSANFTDGAQTVR